MTHWNNEQLTKLRDAWERKSYNTFVLYRSHNSDEMIVLVEREQWSLNRYFLVGDTWRVSMDIRDGSLDDCLRTFETDTVLQLPSTSIYDGWLGENGGDFPS
ncbi:MAG: hypothetical protein KDK05_03860 [Candidatus Competibacteraceae bacterium]|nr:hypothetical protein [Candidatus Competibacteraceae bacterium]